MKTRLIPVAGWMAVVLASTVRGQFVPGHVFAAQSTGKMCQIPADYGDDRIWEIDPETGEATLFVEISDEMCGFLTGLAFTPDGTRLRASSCLRSEILEFDSEGNMSVALDSSDGIACPWGFNNLAYDAAGNFYVLVSTHSILRFPADGGLATVFADQADGLDDDGAIAFAADGDLYFTNDAFDGIGMLGRITPDGNVSVFDTFPGIVRPNSVTADDTGHVYAGLGTGEIFRYDAGDPDSKELWVLGPATSRHSMTMSPDQSQIYLQSAGRVFAIDVVDGSFTTLADFSDPSFFGSTAGIAVVPIPPPPIPTVSGWGLMAMTLFLLTAGTIVIQSGRAGQRPAVPITVQDG